VATSARNQPSAAAAAPGVSARSSLLVLLKATATPASSGLHSWLKMMHCSSPLSAASAIAARATRDAVTTRDRVTSKQITNGEH
jgi:hypothetical protein